MSGSSDLTVECATLVGGYDVGGVADLNTTCSAPKTNRPPIADPYADLEVPEFSGCDETNFQVNPSDTVTISPGVYCNGMTLKGNVTMDPGVYIIDQGTFQVNAGATVTGDGVTIILTSSTGSDHATVTVNGGANMDLSAPTSGDYSGVLFFQDRDSDTDGDNKFLGGSTTEFTGALYFPQQEIRFTGGNAAGGNCTQIVSRIVTFSGNADLNNSCEGTGVPPIGLPGNIRLVL